jgi:hypothetical protein
MIEIRDTLAKEILYDCQLPFEQLYSETAFLYVYLRPIDTSNEVI